MTKVPFKQAYLVRVSTWSKVIIKIKKQNWSLRLHMLQRSACVINQLPTLPLNPRLQTQLDALAIFFL